MVFVVFGFKIPLVHSLRDTNRCKQMWYADDASAGGLLRDLYDWLALLCSRGPAFGYSPQPSKCFVVVAAPFQHQAEDIFGDLGVRIVTGHRFLGGYIGDPAMRDDYVLQKVQQWCKYVRTFAAIASSQPQAAFVAVTKSLQFEWTFLLRVIPGCGPLMTELENCFALYFLPALFGVEVSAAERRLFALPLRYGGLGVSNPVIMANVCFDSSVHFTSFLRDSILGSATIELDAHISSVRSARQLEQKLRSQHYI